MRAHSHLAPATVTPEPHNNVARREEQHALHALATPHELTVRLPRAVHHERGAAADNGPVMRARVP